MTSVGIDVSKGKSTNPIQKKGIITFEEYLRNKLNEIY